MSQTEATSPCSASTRTGANAVSVSPIPPPPPPHLMPTPFCPQPPSRDPASTLVRRSIDVMKRDGVTEVHSPPCPRTPTRTHAPVPGRARNRVRQHPRTLPLRITRLHPRETSLSLLPQRKGRISSCPRRTPRSRPTLPTRQISPHTRSASRVFHR